MCGPSCPLPSPARTTVSDPALGLRRLPEHQQAAGLHSRQAGASPRPRQAHRGSLSDWPPTAPSPLSSICRATPTELPSPPLAGLPESQSLCFCTRHSRLCRHSPPLPSAPGLLCGAHDAEQAPSLGGSRPRPPTPLPGDSRPASWPASGRGPQTDVRRREPAPRRGQAGRSGLWKTLCGHDPRPCHVCTPYERPMKRRHSVTEEPEPAARLPV